MRWSVSLEEWLGLCGDQCMQDTSTGPSLFVLDYYWLSLATIDLVHDNREFEV